MKDLNIYLTQENLETIEKELRELQSVTLPKAIEEVTAARGHGDLSENFEYIAARNELARINRRIAELQGILLFAKTVTKGDTDTINIGTRFIAMSIRNGVADTKLYELVGYIDLKRMHETFADSSKPIPVTAGSPFGKAIRDKKVGEAYSYVDVDNNQVTGEVVSIMPELDINMQSDKVMTI